MFFYFFSGRTSRREIRKLLWERLFWRIKRAKVGRHGSKVHTHSFLFDDDDDDDTERSIATTTAAATPYCALTIHSQNRSFRKNSNTNYPIHLTRRSSFFTCCGYTIDLSNKHSLHSSNGDIISRRSTICKSSTNTTTNNNNNNNNNISPKKPRTHSQSPLSLSSFDRNLRQQTISLRLNNDDNNNNNNNGNHHQQTTRRRATTVIHCFRRIPSSTVTSTSIANHSLTLNKDSLFIRRSISEERTISSIEISPIDISDTPTTTIEGEDNAKISSSKDITDSTVFTPNRLDEKQLSAYIVETC